MNFERFERYVGSTCQRYPKSYMGRTVSLSAPTKFVCSSSGAFTANLSISLACQDED